MSMLRLFWDDNNGTALVITLIMASILTIIGATFTSMVIFQIRNAPWQLRRVQEFYITEAGLDKAIALLKDDDDWSDEGCGDGSATHHFPGEGIWYPLYDPGAGSDVSDFSLDNGTYSVQLRNPPGSDGKAIEIRSEGGIGDNTRIIQIRTQLLGWAVFGAHESEMEGNVSIDSYNSDKGLYEDQIPGENGTIGSNEELELEGSCEIAGNVIIGPDGEVEIEGATVTGSIIRLTEPVDLPPLDIAFSADEKLQMAGHQTYVLTEGIYYFTDIVFSGQAELITNGNVTIYCESASFIGSSKITVNGKLTLYTSGFKFAGSSIINTNKKPEDLMMYCIDREDDDDDDYPDDDGELEGNSVFYGTIYAPNGEVEIHGNHKCYGSIIAREVEIEGNVKIHYDEALGTGDTMVASPTMATSSWHEIY